MVGPEGEVRRPASAVQDADWPRTPNSSRSRSGGRPVLVLHSLKGEGGNGLSSAPCLSSSSSPTEDVQGPGVPEELEKVIDLTELVNAVGPVRGMRGRWGGWVCDGGKGAA